MIYYIYESVECEVLLVLFTIKKEKEVKKPIESSTLQIYITKKSQKV